MLLFIHLQMLSHDCVISQQTLKYFPKQLWKFIQLSKFVRRGRSWVDHMQILNTVTTCHIFHQFKQSWRSIYFVLGWLLRFIIVVVPAVINNLLGWFSASLKQIYRVSLKAYELAVQFKTYWFWACTTPVKSVQILWRF